MSVGVITVGVMSVGEITVGVMTVRVMRRPQKMHAMMPCVVSRIYIVGSLVVLERGVMVRRNCNIFNLAMENVLKGLPDKISCPDTIHKCTSNVHIFLITFKLRDRGDEIGFLFFNV
jgi:hypothetical protein